MTQPKKLTVPQLQAQIVKRQGALLAQIATRHRKRAELDDQIAELHAQLHALPSTMVDVWDLGRRAGYAVRAVPEPSDDTCPPGGHALNAAYADYIAHIEHLRYGYAGVENLCKCTTCRTEKENAS